MNDQSRILIIDDEAAICDACSQVFKRNGHAVSACHDGETGLKQFDEFKPDLVFVDLKMPGLSGHEVIEKIRERNSDTVLIVITGYATIESAVESMKRGAFDFLPKPFTPEELNVITKRALEKRMSTLETQRLREEKEKMQRNFQFLVSHELKTPLAAVMQYIEVLSQGIVGGLSQEQEKIVIRIKTRIAELLALIERWLKLSILEDTAIQGSFVTFDLRTILDRVIDMLRAMAEEKNITVTFDKPSNALLARGDGDMIQEVFVNLISNGIKYNREGGKVTVSTAHKDGMYVIDVVDTGIGIPEQEIPKVTEEFYCVGTQQKRTSSGLGLAIVKKILGVHHGTLEIMSTLNKGSTFRVSLPEGQ